MKLLLPASLLLLSLACSRLVVAADSAAPSTASAKSAPRPFAAIPLGNPRGLAVDSAGNLFVGDVDSGKVHKITPAGEVTELSAGGAAAIKIPLGLAVGRDGTVIVADSDDNAVHRISRAGAVVALARPTGEAAFSGPTSAAADSAGNIFVTNNRSNTILKLTPAGVAAVFAGKAGASGSTDGAGSVARFNTPRGLAIDAKDNLYVADEGNSNIRKITPAGEVSTLAGTAPQSGSVDATGSAARFNAPRGLAVDAAGTIYVADTDNHSIRKITAARLVSTLAGQAGQSGNADGTGSAARFSEPRGIAVDPAGNVFVADTGNRSVRQITPEGVVTTIVATAPPTAPAPPAPYVALPAPLVPPRTGSYERVDYSHAETLDGWDADPTYWTVKDGVFTAKGEKVPSTFLLTKKNYTDFRLTLSSQMVESTNHAGVCFWGETTVERNGLNKWAYKGPLVIFPGLGFWDYRTKKGIAIDPVGKALAKKIAGQNDLILVEILAQGNRVRVAYNGQQVLDWREPDPSLLKDGPIGLQLHGFTPPQIVIYKDVVIESFPKEDRLITVKP